MEWRSLVDTSTTELLVSDFFFPIIKNCFLSEDTIFITVLQNSLLFSRSQIKDMNTIRSLNFSFCSSVLCAFFTLMLSDCKGSFTVLQQWWWAKSETGKHFWQLSMHVHSTERKQLSNSASNSLQVWQEDSEDPFSFLYFNSCCWGGTLHCGCQLWCLYVIHSSPRGSSQGGCIQMGLPNNPGYSAGCHLLWSDKDLKRWRGKAVWVHPRRWRCKSFSLLKLSLKGKCRWSGTMKQMFGSWCQMNTALSKVSFTSWHSPKVHVAVNCFFWKFVLLQWVGEIPCSSKVPK